MKLLAKYLLLIIILGFYALLYWATTKCDEDCDKRYELRELLEKDRDYVYGVNRCYSNYNTDTLCVYVRDTVGIDWNRFADTICSYANSVGLRQQKLILITMGSTRYDTVVRKQCP